MSIYKPLKIKTLEFAGLKPAFDAMRLPTGSVGDEMGLKDRKLAEKLVKAGDSHGKFTRGIMVWSEMEFQVGFMIELDTYKFATTLSTSSSMLQELKHLKGDKLAEQKQKDLSTKVYKRIAVFNYQTLRNIYKQRKSHRHSDWQIFVRWIERLPLFGLLIGEKNV